MLKKIVSILIICLLAFSFEGFAQQEKNTPKRAKISKRLKTKEAKYEAALAYYDQGAYLTASQLFEEIYPLYIAAPQGDTILFLFASSYYNNNDFLMAAFHFTDYVRRYPQSDRVELASFLSAKCYYLNSPAYYLDQTDSYYAIERLEMFVNTFPASQYAQESNLLIDTMRNKLARKELSIGKMYHNTESYQAAQVSLNNLLKDYPDSYYCEEAMYYLVKNSYAYAQNSIDARKVERYQMTIDDKNKFLVAYPESKYLTEVNKIANEAQKKRDKILENKN